MDTKKFYKNITSVLKNWLPIEDQGFDLQTILSPHQLRLPSSVYDQAQTLIKSIYALKHDTYYADYVLKPSGYKPQPHNAVLMAYDFHYSDQKLKLIEVNTNASGYLLSHLCYKVQNDSNQKALDDLKYSFKNDYELFYNKSSNNLNIAIIDENPEQQKMYLEFLMYKSLFESWGWSCEIQDFSKPILDFDFIYNRYCDFDFSEKQSQHLKQAYVNKKICISPHPVEYLLFAHKDRFISWTAEDSPLEENIKNMIPKTDLVTSFEDKDELWKQRKGLFFKPRFLYGGKAVYNGKSISRKLFDKICDDENFLAQETCKPSTTLYNDEEWKFDLRFYVYKDQIQQAIARIYQGQVTNFSTKNGGFSPVIFE
ncbi:MAG: hypothetical protein MK008_13640 [Bdellovibrionales bacterium]|nr:hypothetical protein [Bdellovibrionales bacterium]